MTKLGLKSRTLVLLAILLLTPFALTACQQFSMGTVSLTLIDEATGGRKAYVSARLVPVGEKGDRERRTQSVDDNGVVIFKEVPPGEWRLEIVTSQGDVLENDLGTITIQTGRTVNEDVQVGESIGKAQDSGSGGGGGSGGF